MACYLTGCGLAAAGLLFEYLGMLRAAGPQRWAYDEQAAIAQMRFRFQVARAGLRPTCVKVGWVVWPAIVAYFTGPPKSCCAML